MTCWTATTALSWSSFLIFTLFLGLKQTIPWAWVTLSSLLTSIVLSFLWWYYRPRSEAGLYSDSENLLYGGSASGGVCSRAWPPWSSGSDSSSSDEDLDPMII